MTFRKWRFPTGSTRYGPSGWCHLSVAQDQGQRNHGMFWGWKGSLRSISFQPSWLNLFNPLKPGHGYYHWIALRSIFHRIMLDLTKLFASPTGRVFLNRANKRKKGILRLCGWRGKENGFGSTDLIWLPVTTITQVPGGSGEWNQKLCRHIKFTCQGKHQNFFVFFSVVAECFQKWGNTPS